MNTTLNYPELMNAMWNLVNTSHNGQQKFLEGLPAAIRPLIEAARGGRLDIELARRRKSLSGVLSKCFPVTYFAFVAREGADGVMRFFESEAWRTRPAQAGSIYPACAPTAAAFLRYLDERGWRDEQQEIVQRAYDFEARYLFRPPFRQTRAVDGMRVRLADDTWVAEAPFDVPALASNLIQRCREETWEDALFFASYDPCPFAVFSQQTGPESIRRLRITGDAVVSLRWLWDDSIPVAAATLRSSTFLSAQEHGLVSVERS